MRRFSKLIQTLSPAARRAVMLAAVLLLIVVALVSAALGVTIRVSIASDGMQGNNDSRDPSISADGRYIAFESEASNLVIGDTNGFDDIFVRDRTTGTTTRVSVASDGTEANGDSDGPPISGDGRFVAFSSYATNLVANDTNVAKDVFVHDRTTRTTTRVSVDSGENQSSLFSFSSEAVISADGRFVAFESDATNLVAGDINGKADVFVRDRQAGTTTRISVDSVGAEGNDHSFDPAISGDGRFVAFSSWADNLVIGDTNGDIDIFVHNLTTGATTRASVANGGAQANGASYKPALSYDGRFLAFDSDAGNLVAGDTNAEDDVFVRDRMTGITTRVSVVSGGIEAVGGNSEDPAISGDGRYVAFESRATNLVPGDVNAEDDIFVHDRATGITTRVTVDSAGIEADLESDDPAFSTDGRYVAFDSHATNLVDNDTNAEDDVFVHDYLGESSEVEDEPECTLVGSDGGVFTLDNGAVLIVPPGSVTDDTCLTWDIFAHPGPDSSGAYPLSFAIDIRLVDINGASLISFSPPLELCLPVTDAHITKAGSVDALRLAWRSNMDDGKPWTLLSTLVKMVDGHGQMACAPTNHLTVFALFEAGSQPLPATGFPPRWSRHAVEGGVTTVGAQHNAPGTDTLDAVAASLQDAGMLLEIPRIGVTAPILGVPETTVGWDVAWLGDKIGWLDGTAYPTWEGNTVLTGHVYDADGEPGVFANLRTLWWGDRVVIRAWGQEHIYAVRSVKLERANSQTSIKHEDLDWVTLVTCSDFDETTGEYRWRTVIRALRVE
jgi:LPXTG-site transpeptidase (sortase) family protein